jgi:hypothetical protein
MNHKMVTLDADGKIIASVGGDVENNNVNEESKFVEQMFASLLELCSGQHRQGPLDFEAVANEFRNMKRDALEGSVEKVSQVMK